MEEVSEQQFTREDLILKGFNFKYFTSIDPGRQGTSYYWIYDKAYCILKNGHIALLQNSTTNDSIKLPQAKTATLATAQHNGTSTHRSRVEHNHWSRLVKREQFLFMAMDSTGHSGPGTI